MPDDDTIPTKCESHHNNEGLSPMVLIAMRVGTPHELDLEKDPFQSYARKTSLRLSRQAMGNEAKRQLKDHDASEEGKPNNHFTLAAYNRYLKQGQSHHWGT